MNSDPILNRPLYWVPALLLMTLMLHLFFDATWIEILLFFLIDNFAYACFSLFEMRLFVRWVEPESRHFFPKLDIDRIGSLDQPQKLAFYHALQRFPGRRSLWILFASVFKVLPAIGFGLAAWSAQSSPGDVLLKSILICSFTFSYFVGWAFFGYQHYISLQLAQIHERYDWSDVFRSIPLTQRYRGFQGFELASMFGVWLIALAMVILIYEQRETHLSLAYAKIFLVFVFALAFVYHIMFTSRRQIIDGLYSLVDFHKRARDGRRSQGLALSTHPTLAWYQKAFNDLIDRHTNSERELHRWIYRQAEESRYHQIGRIAGLLVHDLLAPLTAMRQCVYALEESKSEDERQRKFVDLLRYNIDHTLDFVQNLRHTIRDNSQRSRHSSLTFAHESAIKLASYMHELDRYAKIRFQWLIEGDLEVEIPQPELNQIFLNLYSNAASNLLTHNVTEPEVQIRLVAASQDDLRLEISDNGTGLDPVTFLYITEEAERLPGQSGVGLKLTKRLIEIHGGHLELRSNSPARGSTFILRLPRALKERKDTL